ncbi:MAG TPA: glycoside hydrolase family 172 protein [Terriglobales bacterium]|nr:glycoside hydrolase family 172 protein [Terriglobales bacterium]
MKLNLLFATLIVAVPVLCQSGSYDGLQNSLANIYRLSNAKTFSISPENPTGEKGKGGMATEGTNASFGRHLGGQGWKVSPSIIIESGRTATLATIDGSGMVNHIWLTPIGNWRLAILRMYWDDENEPSVEVPVGDFFAMGLLKPARIASLPICVNPNSGFNAYWPMPFRRKAKITMQNLDEGPMQLYFQIDYSMSQVSEDAAYFHAQFRRVNPLPYKEVYTILDGVKGKGQYVGTYMTWGVHNNGWWGEGEVKFYLDGDKDFPTINGTGTEDYFGGSIDFENEKGRYEEFTSPYSGLVQVIQPDGIYRSQQKFGLYRWHITDQIRFESDLRVTIQALGIAPRGTKFIALQDDISSVAFWYQAEPHVPFPKLPGRESLEIN